MIIRRVLWAAWVLSASALFFFENNSGTEALLMASVLVPFISTMCAFICSRRVEVSVTAKTENSSISIHFDLSPSVFCRANAVIAVNNLMNGDKAEKRLANGTHTLENCLCGLTEVTVRDIVYSDLFGFFAFPSRANAHAETTVMPVLHPFGFSAVGGARETELVYPREYIPGDPIKLINWKLSEKLDKTMVRSENSGEPDRILLFLDTSVPSDSSPSDISLCAEDFLSCAKEFIPCEAIIGQKERIFVLSEAEFTCLLLSVLSARFEKGIPLSAPADAALVFRTGGRK